MERYLENGDASVECDNKQGGRLATEHLISKGCKKLLHISGVSETVMPADDRALGFVEVCRENKIWHKEIATNMYQYNKLEYHESLEDALRQFKDVDGIFASSDLIAAQILQVCSKLKIRVPEDIKLVGFDDVNISSLTTPRITTVHQPVKEMAELAMDTIIRLNENKTVPMRSILPVRLVEREST